MFVDFLFEFPSFKSRCHMLDDYYACKFTHSVRGLLQHNYDFKLMHLNECELGLHN